MTYKNASPGIRRLLDKQASRKCEHCGTIGCYGFASPYCRRCCSNVTRCGSPTVYYPKLKMLSEELRMLQHVLLKNADHPGVKLARGILADAITACHNGHTLLKFAGPVLGDMYIEPREDLEKLALTIISMCAAICYADEFTKRGKFTSQRHLVHVIGKRVIRLGPPMRDPGPRICRELGQWLLDRCGVFFKNLAKAADGMYQTMVNNNEVYSQEMEVTINGV